MKPLLFPEVDREAGPYFNKEVCEALGIRGFPTYGAQAPGHTGSCWYSSDDEHEIRRVISEVDQRAGETDWRRGSTVSTLTIYPDVSGHIAGAWQLVDAVAEQHARVSIYNRAVGPWACCVMRYVGTPQEEQHFQYAVTAPLAIARAAWSAFGAMEVAS